MNEGYVKLYRKLRDNPISSNLELMGFFSYVLLNANFKQGSFYLGLEKIIIEPGQLVTSQLKLSKQFKISLSKIHRMLKVLENEGILKIKGKTKYTIIEICNWYKYQGNEKQIENNEKTNEKQTETIEEEIRIIKNNKEIYMGEELKKFSEEEYKTNQSAYLLRSFFILGYKPSQEETVESFRKWFKEKILDKHKFSTASDIIGVIDNFETYWLEEKTEQERLKKNWKTTFMNNPYLNNYKK